MRKDLTRNERRILPAVALTTILGLGMAACSGGSGGEGSPSASGPAANSPASTGEAAGASHTPTTSPEVTAQLTNTDVASIPGLMDLAGSALGFQSSELQVSNQPLSGGYLVDVQISPPNNEMAPEASTVGIEISPDTGPNNFAYWYGIAKANSEPATAKIAPDVNGHPAVWSADHLLMTDIGGNMLQVTVTAQDSNGLDLSTNESYAGQIASSVATNAFTQG